VTRDAFENALDAGQLQTLIIYREGEKWYTCRRNGKTKTWKRDGSRWEIPIKFRWRDTLRVESKHFYNGEVDKWFRVVQDEPAMFKITEMLRTDDESAPC